MVSLFAPFFFADFICLCLGSYDLRIHVLGGTDLSLRRLHLGVLRIPKPFVDDSVHPWLPVLSLSPWGM